MRSVRIQIVDLERVCKVEEKQQGTTQFSHFDEKGNAIMVDVGEKKETNREATARGTISMSKECYDKVMNRTMKKGDVLSVAQVAGIMGAKQTPQLIPLCHILNLTKVSITYECDEKTHSIHAFCTVKTVGKTGVEMEALTGVNVCLLTIYDMCKAIDKTMEISGIYVCKKAGGKSGTLIHPKEKR